MKSVPPRFQSRYIGESGKPSYLAEALRVDVLLIDEQVGRTIALSRNLPLSGTLGVLERADRMGFVSDFPLVLQRLKTSGFFITEALELQLLERHRTRLNSDRLDDRKPARCLRNPRRTSSIRKLIGSVYWPVKR